MNADAMLDKGDLDGYAVWTRILRAVEELEGTAPRPGAALVEPLVRVSVPGRRQVV